VTHVLSHPDLRALPELWHKHAVIYCLDVKSFADDDGNGIGDFQGLTRRLDYLAGLNVNCVWLQPFYPSPQRDNGYDITDYYNIDSNLGTLGDFVEFSHKARDRGIRVMIDLVVNHTSIDHPWFQAARSDPASMYRNYYVWSSTLPADANEGMVFPGPQQTTWTFDAQAGAYYFHRYYDQEPELNIANPLVRKEIAKIVAFWLELGVSGFRVDSVPFLIEFKGIPNTDGLDPHDYLRGLRFQASWHRGDAVLLGEANLVPEEVPAYFGTGDQMHMIFNFWVNQHLFLALAREDATVIRRAYDALPPIPGVCQWVNFLRTHDELDLGRLSPEEREEVYRAFGPEERMQLYGRGIRRRLAPMFHNDRMRLELAHSLIFTLPGTPLLRYGDEIGMGEDLTLTERNSVRTPMQWSNTTNGGFSTAPEDRLVLPVITGGEYGYQRVNVATQQRDAESLLNWVEAAARVRRQCPEFGSGRYEWLDTDDRAVLAHMCHGDQTMVFAVHNLSARNAPAALSLPGHVIGLHDLLANRPEDLQHGGKQRIELEPYGYRWFRAKLSPESAVAGRRTLTTP